MVRCWKCGRENEDAMRFCTNCGTPLTPSQAGEETIADSSQAATISFNAPPQTATGRGGVTNPYTTPTPTPFTESAPKSRTGMVVGVIVGALLLGLIGLGAAAAYYYYSSGKDVASNNSNTKQRTLGPDEKATPAPANRNDNATSEPSPTPASKQTFEAPTTPTKEGSFTVYANEGWQLSDIAVVPLEKYTSTTEGIVDIADVKTGVRAAGVSDAKFKSRRLYSEFPVGALLMRTRYANGKYSNMVATGTSGSWENLPDERGMLEFIINDNSPENNGGQFTIRVKMTSAPKAKP